MRVIDRYIIRETLLPSALGLLVFTSLLIIPFLIEQAEDLIAKNVPGEVILQLISTLLPQALGIAIPMALLLGLLVAFGRISGDREFVALQACGVSLWRLLRPVAVLSLAAFGATLYVLLVALPNANQTFREISFNILVNRAEGEVKPRVFFDQFPDLVLYVRDIPPEGGWREVFLADVRPGQPEAIYLARRGGVAIDRDRQSVAMVLEDGSRHIASEDGEYEVYTFERLVLNVNPDRIFPARGPEKGEREMSISELNARIAERAALGLPVTSARIEIYKKFSIPFACIVLGLIGLALGVSNRKDGRLSSFVVGLIVIFAYYALLEGASNVAKGQVIPTWLSVWLPNIAFGLLGLWLFRSRLRSSDGALPTPAWLRRAVTAVSAARRARSAPPAPWLPAFHVPMLGLLDRYVALAYLRILLLAIFGLLGVFYISTFLDLSDEVMRGDAAWSALLQHFWYATPQYLSYVVPIAVLLAGLVTVGLLTKNSELVIMKACGISLYRASLPILLSALVAAGALAALQESLLGPWNRRAEALRHVIRGGSPETFDVTYRRWAVGRDGQIYHYAYYDTAQEQLSALSIYQFRGDMRHLARRTYAERAFYLGPETGVQWRAQEGWTREFADGGEALTYEPFDQGDVTLEPPSYFSTQRPDPDFMNYLQLRTHIDSLRQSGLDVTGQLVALHRKVSFPFATVIMTLIAVPFAVTTGRRGALYGIGAGIVLALGYWGAMSVSGALGTGGLLAPALAAWTPNLLFSAGALYLLLTVRT